MRGEKTELGEKKKSYCFVHFLQKIFFSLVSVLYFHKLNKNKTFSGLHIHLHLFTERLKYYYAQSEVWLVESLGIVVLEMLWKNGQQGKLWTNMNGSHIEPVSQLRTG